MIEAVIATRQILLRRGWTLYPTGNMRRDRDTVWVSDRMLYHLADRFAPILVAEIVDACRTRADVLELAAGLQGRVPAVN